MTTSTDTSTVQNGGTPNGEQAAPGEGNANVDALLDDLNGGQAAASDDAADDLLLAGWNSARGGDKPKFDVKDPNEGSDDGEGGQANGSAGAPAQQQAQPDPLADLRATIDQRFATLEKGVTSANGLAGHLKQQLGQLAKGKQLTAADLPRITEEFGTEYAEALVEDLNKAGLGGASVSEAALNELVTARTTEIERKFEQKLVLTRHPDALDYFAQDPKNPGKHYAAFAGWISTLPQERQAEIGEAWDSDVVSRYLSDFKTAREAASKQQQRQQSRVARAVVPTGGASGAIVDPAEDPLTMGWNRAKGVNKGARAAVAGGR